LASFTNDADLHDLVYYRLLCISEAVRSISTLDPELELRFPDIMWSAIRGIGNILRHQYDDVDATLIWQTISLGRLQALIDAAASEVARLDA